MTNRYGDLLKEFYTGIKNDTLSEPRMGEIQRVFNELWDRETKYSLWLPKEGNKIAEAFLDLPFAPIYSQVFEEDKAEIVVPIPATYKHLHVYGQGRITGASGGTVFCQFNDDSGNNYQWVFILGNGSTATSGQDTSDPRIPIGQFSNTGDPAGSASSFIAQILNYPSPFHQNVHANTLYNDNTTRSIYEIAGKWSNTSGIKKMRIFAADGTGVDGSTSMAQGGVLSVWGMK
jgi:hypothetical protein